MHTRQCVGKVLRRIITGKSMKNNAKRAFLNALREKSEEELTQLKNCPNGMFRQVR